MLMIRIVSRTTNILVLSKTTPRLCSYSYEQRPRTSLSCCPFLFPPAMLPSIPIPFSHSAIRFVVVVHSQSFLNAPFHYRFSSHSPHLTSHTACTSAAAASSAVSSSLPPFPLPFPPFSFSFLPSLLPSLSDSSPSLAAPPSRSFQVSRIIDPTRQSSIDCSQFSVPLPLTRRSEFFLFLPNCLIQIIFFDPRLSSFPCMYVCAFPLRAVTSLHLYPHSPPLSFGHSFIHSLIDSPTPLMPSSALSPSLSALSQQQSCLCLCAYSLSLFVYRFSASTASVSVLFSALPSSLFVAHSCLSAYPNFREIDRFSPKSCVYLLSNSSISAWECVCARMKSDDGQSNDTPRSSEPPPVLSPAPFIASTAALIAFDPKTRQVLVLDDSDFVNGVEKGRSLNHSNFHGSLPLLTIEVWAVSESRISFCILDMILFRESWFVLSPIISNFQSH